MSDSTLRGASLFVDEVELRVEAGAGGDGMVAWRREKFVEFGGPFGGDGGRGGSVFVEADPSLSTLLDLSYRRVVKAERGRGGATKGMHGRAGEDVKLRVPVGTQIFDADTDALLADLTEPWQVVTVAEGGKGGWGNMRFGTSTNRTPDFAYDGKPGQARNVRMELKLLADVGIIGYPSVGKSTLISVLSNARPRIAAYPFTTLVPNLGVVAYGDHQSFVVADIPGLIEGASEGRGLGIQFLRHVERCSLLVHVLDVPPPFDDGSGVEWTEREPMADFERLNRELANFNPALAERPQIVVLNKADLPHVQERVEALTEAFEALGHPLLTISAANRQNLRALVEAMGSRLREIKPELFDYSARPVKR